MAPALTLKDLHDAQLKAWEDLKAIHTRSLEEAKADWLNQANTISAEYKEQLAKANLRIEELEDLMTKTQVRLNRPGMWGQHDPRIVELSPDAKAFSRYTRKGQGVLTPDELKLLSYGDDTQGGYLVPPERASTILEILIQFSPIRELANVVTMTSGNSWEQPKEGPLRFLAQWVSEVGTRGETQGGNFGMERIQVFDAFANPLATQDMLDDANYNFDSWLDNRLGMAFAVLEGAAFVSGNGVGKPEGLLSAQRIANLLAMVPTQIVNSGDNAGITADGLINLIYSLPEFYTRNATFLMRRATMGAVRLLKNGFGQYLWQPGLIAGQPNMLLDYPYREVADMPAVALNSYPVLFGDIRKAYTIVDRSQMPMLRDPYSSKGFVSLYTSRRVGGQPVLDEAYSLLKISA
jgi:HK97 family phage major capsid protein